MKMDEHLYHHVFDSVLATELGVDGTGIVLFKSFDEGRNDFSGDFTEEAIMKFINDNNMPTIMSFD